MKLFIGEKPDIAKDIVRNLEEPFNKKKDYYVSDDNNTYVTWCYGHLLEIKCPEDKWDIKNLPLRIYPPKMQIKQNVFEHTKEIIQLIKKSDLIIHAGDPDDEGQLLIQELLEFAQYEGKVERLILNNNTDKAIKTALKNLRNNNEEIFQQQYKKAFIRQIADTTYGLSLTQACTIKNDNKLLSVGRVQTPMLSLIVKRYLDNKNHQESFYYLINGYFEKDNVGINANIKAFKSEDEENTKKIVGLLDQNVAKIINIKEDILEVNPPLPFSLVRLQQEANKLYGLSANNTLKITQELREKYKAITYNRSDCSYLSESQFEEAPIIIQKLSEIYFSNIPFNTNIKSKAWNDNEITAHTAIIPTENIPNVDELSEDQNKIYLLISKYFLSQFLPPKKYKTLTISISIADYIFEKTFKEILDVGFDCIFDKIKIMEEDEHSDDIVANIDQYKVFRLEDEIKIKTISYNKIKTKPKPLFTEASFLAAITKIADFIDNEEVKKILKEKDKGKKGENGGIGTPATRSSRLEILKERGYIVVEKNKLIPTQLGLEFIETLPKELSNLDFTAELIQKCNSIADGNDEIDNFIEYLHEKLEKIINNLEIKVTSENKIKCPICEGEIKKGKETFFCVNKDLFLPQIIAKKKLTDINISDLCKQGETKTIKGFTKKDGSKFDSKLYLDNEYKIKFKK